MNRHDRRVRRREARLAGASPAHHPAPEPSKVPAVPRPSFIERARWSSQRAENVGSDDADPLPESDAEGDAATEQETAPRRPVRKTLSARAAIVGAAIEAAASPAQRRSWQNPKKPKAVVMHVPTTSWIKPVEQYFDALQGGRWVTFARNGSMKARDKSDVGNDEVAAWLAENRNVVGIAADIRMLPASLVSTADMTVTVASPAGGVLRTAMKRCLTGKVPATLDDALAAGLDLDDLVAAFRPGSTPAQVVERLRAAARTRGGLSAGEDLPDLQNAVEYGEARTWGLALARDIADYRAGRISWAEIDRGAVLHSEPGFGKSLFARVLARACNIPLVVFSVAELFAAPGGAHLDGVLRAQRGFFAKAAALADPFCLLFCDEIDAIPSRNSLSRSHNADYWLPVISDLLCLLDSAVGDGGPGGVRGGGTRAGVIVLGATNRPHALDPAIIRPGRLERLIEIGRPDAAGVQNILRFHLKGDLPDADLGEVSQMMEGATAAEVMATVRAARRVARHARRDLTVDDLRGRITGPGNESPGYLRRVAVHEAAHAVSSVVLPVGTLKRVQLRSQGRAGGHTLIERGDNMDLATLANVEDRVTSILSAEVAERIIVGAASTGSGGDDRSDIGIATAMLAVLHTSTVVTGNLFHRSAPDNALETARADPRLRRIIARHLRLLERRAESLVTEHRDAIVAVADELVRTRHLSGDAVRAIVEWVRGLTVIH
jgi:cell division protease FtsH